MKIGIIVFSQTGNTRKVAEKLKARLSAGGHEAVIEEVIPQGEVTPGMKNVSFDSAPEVSGYEGVVFASPVQAFSLAAAMGVYLKQIASLEGKKIACFVTKQLAGKWTGGNHAIRQISNLCKARGATPAASDVIIWSSKKRDQMIEETIDTISAAF